MRTCIREPLAAARTYYVRTDGSDSNSGLVDSASGAFRTIQKAIDETSETLDLGPYAVLIQVRSGTYQESVRLKPFLGTATVTLPGDVSTPSNVVIAPSAGAAVTANTPASWIIEGFKLTSADSHALSVAGQLLFQAIDFGACAAYHISCTAGADATAIGNYRISGGAAAHVTADSSGASYRADGRTVTITNTPAFSVGFAYAVRASAIMLAGMTFSGAATGSRYVSQSNSVIDTSGGGANYLPGNAAGSTATGGIYL